MVTKPIIICTPQGYYEWNGNAWVYVEGKNNPPEPEKSEPTNWRGYGKYLMRFFRKIRGLF